jgi:hypothetical protein
MIPEKLKDPDATLDYGVRWAVNGWLDADETVTSSSWTVEAGITKQSDSISSDGKTTVVWLAGGTVNTDYLITNHIVTSKGRQDDRSMLILCRQR